jgi:hypothetical protein
MTTLNQRTESHGAFAFLQVKPGKYQLQATKENRISSKWIEVKAGQVVSADVMIQSN